MTENLWEIIRTNLDDLKSERFRLLHGDTEDVPKRFCKKFNAFATRNDFPNLYTYRAKK